MKKITRIAALLAAGALLFGAVGCSSGGDGDETPQGPQTETVSYTLKTGTDGFESGSLKVSGMNTTDDTSDDTFEMTLKPTGKAAVTVTGTWELTDTGFVCKPDANVTIDDITVNAGESVSGTLNEDNSEITLEVKEGVYLVFVKDEDSGGTPPEAGEGDSYDFADLSAADFTTLGVTVTGSNDIKIATTNTAATPYKVLGGKVGIVTTVTNKLTVKPKDGAPLAIGFNTNGVTNAAAVGDSATLAHFITYPVESGKNYKMEITSGGQANKTTHKFVVTDTTGKVLALKDCISSTTDAVTLSFEAAEEKVCLSVLRTDASGTSYVGKVTITEISGGDSSNNGSETPGGTPGEDGGEEGDENNSGTVTPGTPGSGEGEDGGEEGDGNGGTVTPGKPDDEETPAAGTYTLEASALTESDIDTSADGKTTEVGTSKYFTIYWSTGMAVDSSSKSWDDGYSSTKRIKMNGKWTGNKQFIKFTTTKAATVKVWWVSGGDGRTIDIAKYTGSTPTSADVVDSDGDSCKQNDILISTLNLTEAGTWALGCAVNGNYIFKVEVTE